MTKRRTPANPEMLATARLAEILAELMPQVRDHARVEIRHADGYVAQSASPTVRGDGLRRRSAPDGERWCTVGVPSGEDPDELVDCARPRPCPEHDRPVTLTPVERAAGERMRIEQSFDDFRAQCTAASFMVMQAIESGRKILGTRVALEVPRCSSEGRDGAIEWGDPTCSAVPSRGPICDRCGQREYRWRKSHGLKPRDNGVFSGEAVSS